ncbi:hypothetical protein SAMN05216391_1088 [Lachnospiraceae bacterium KHCPX20]|nr:hypothetical protein SAMN05216391_1088 [Lachnospiraceae bacterium KHCPX20]
MSHYFGTVAKFIQNVIEEDDTFSLWINIESNGIQIHFHGGFTVEEEPPENKIIINDEDFTQIKIGSDAIVYGTGLDHEIMSFKVVDKQLGSIDVSMSNPFTAGIPDIYSLIPKEYKEECNKTSA